MRARIYHRLNRALLDLGVAFVPSEEALLEGLTQLYARELLALRQQILKLFPDALIEREKLFRSEPMYLSLLILTTAEEHQVGSALDQMRMDGQVAAWEATDQEKHPSLRWLLEKQPRRKTLPRDIEGYVFLRAIGPLFQYHLRVLPEEIPELDLQGINASTGQSFFPQTETNGVITLDFSLDLGESLLLWCYQGNEHAVVATVLLRQMSHLILEKEEGLHIRHQTAGSGGISLSP